MPRMFPFRSVCITFSLHYVSFSYDFRHTNMCIFTTFHSFSWYFVTFRHAHIILKVVFYSELNNVEISTFNIICNIYVNGCVSIGNYILWILQLYINNARRNVKKCKIENRKSVNKIIMCKKTKSCALESWIFYTSRVKKYYKFSEKLWKQDSKFVNMKTIPRSDILFNFKIFQILRFPSGFKIRRIYKFNFEYCTLWDVINTVISIR